MDRRQLAGRSAEADCANYLRRKGWKPVEMNYRCRGGEIDIIAEQYPKRRLRPLPGGAPGYIVFVEVKYRGEPRLAEPREAVTPQKQRRIKLAASYWLASHDTDLQPRFDVIEVIPGKDGPEFNHIENAFE